MQSLTRKALFLDADDLVVLNVQLERRPKLEVIELGTGRFSRKFALDLARATTAVLRKSRPHLLVP